MNRLLFISWLLCISFIASSQTGYLFVEKGYKKKKTYGEGDRITLRVKDGVIYSGIITLLINDTIYINGHPIPRVDVTTVILNSRLKQKFHLEAKDLAYIIGGTALTTAGLTLSKQADFKEALTAGIVIGFSPIVLGYLKSKISFKRRWFRIGKKFRLHMLEFHIPHKRPF
ncbi:MAG: hypothetical protein ABI480_02205 [Chitinophagaceae bacterium]